MEKYLPLTNEPNQNCLLQNKKLYPAPQENTACECSTDRSAAILNAYDYEKWGYPSNWVDRARTNGYVTDVHEVSERDFINALFRPDLHTNIFFPYQFNSPGTPIHKLNTVSLVTNSKGVAWAEVNFGQFLGANSFLATGTTATGVLGRSNVFVSNTVSPALDGFTPFVPGVGLVENIQASNIMAQGVDVLNSVRAGPAAVWYDFTGRLDISAGTVNCGINYSFASDPAAPTTANGLLPDTNYLTKKAIEDCPIRYEGSPLTSIHATFIPHDQNVLDLRSPNAGQTGIVQRFFILITGATPNSQIGQLKIAMNYDGKPNPQFADYVASSVMNYPSTDTMRRVANNLVAYGKVIEKVEDTGLGVARFGGKI